MYTAALQPPFHRCFRWIRGFYKFVGLHLQRRKISKHSIFQSTFHTCCQQLIAEETMLSFSVVLVLLIEKPVYHCTLPISFQEEHRIKHSSLTSNLYIAKQLIKSPGTIFADAHCGTTIFYRLLYIFSRDLETAIF